MSVCLCGCVGVIVWVWVMWVGVCHCVCVSMIAWVKMGVGVAALIDSITCVSVWVGVGMIVWVLGEV